MIGQMLVDGCSGMHIGACLFDGGEVDIKPLVRPFLQEAELRQAFVDCVVQKPDQHYRYGNRQMSSIGG